MSDEGRRNARPKRNAQQSVVPPRKSTAKKQAVTSVDDDESDLSEMSEIEVAVTQSTRAPRAAKSKVAVPSPVAESDDEDDEMEVDEDDDEEEDEDEDGEEEDFRPNKSKATPKKTPVKKPIRGKESVKSKPVPDAKAKGQRKPSTKKNKTKVTLVEHGDMEIADDNGLFNALLNPQTPIQSTLEDWLLAFQATGGSNEDDREEEKAYLAELVAFIWRTCGLSNEITPDVADDIDAVPDRIDDVHTELQETKEAPLYPLISKAKAFKSIHNNLPQFLTTLIEQLSNTPLLYVTQSTAPPDSGPTTPVIQLLLTWLNPMTMSPFRGIRHTATFISLWLGVGICRVAKGLRESIKTAEKGKEIELGKQGKARKANAGKVKAFEAQIADGEEKSDILDEYLADIENGVFVHRYRDKDPLIRADCLNILAKWMKANPDKFVTTEHLRYVDWALTDEDHHTRLEAIRALTPLYSHNGYMSSIRTFTTRAIPRIMEMAVRDINVSVRTEAIRVLVALDSSGDLNDADEGKKLALGCLLFDRDVRIRKAIAVLVKNWCDEDVSELEKEIAEEEQRLQQGPTTSNKGKRSVVKKTRKAPNRRGRDLAEDDVQEEESDADMQSDEDAAEEERAGDAESRYVEIKVLMQTILSFSDRLSVPEPEPTQGAPQGTQTQVQRDRTFYMALRNTVVPTGAHASTAAETLSGTDWSIIQDWKVMVEFLAMDHATNRDDGKRWALSQEEERFFMDFVTVILQGAAESKKKVDDDENTCAHEISQTLVETLPKLITKFQNDSRRMVDVLRLGRFIRFEMYSDLRLIPAYEALWSDLNRLFLKHTDPLVLQEILSIMTVMNGTQTLQFTNNVKFAEVEESLADSLREVFAEKDLAIMALEDEDVETVESALLRTQTMMARYDLTGLFLIDKQDEANLFDIALALASRGKLGFRQEIKIVQHAMTVLLLYLSWTMRNLSLDDVQTEDAERERVESQRDAVLAIFQQHAVSNETNALEAIRRDSVGNLLRLHMLFRPIADNPADAKSAPARKVLSLTMDDAVQYRCAGAIQAAIERQTDYLDDDGSSDASSVLTDIENEADASRSKQQPKTKRAMTAEALKGLVELQDLLWVFIHAMRCRVIDAQHSGIVLSQYGRIDQAFDAALPSLVEILQEEGLYNKDSDMVTTVVGKALQESFEFYLDTPCKEDPIQTLELAKLASRAFFVHKAHFKVQRQLDVAAISEFHEDGMRWSLSKAAGYFKQEKANKIRNLKEKFKARATGAIAYFRVLSLMVPGLDAREAILLKDQLQTMLTDLDLKPGKTKQWEPLFTYEKRLLVLASHKEPSKVPARKQIGKERQSNEDNQQTQVRSSRRVGEKQAKGVKSAQTIEDDDEAAEGDEDPNHKMADTANQAVPARSGSEEHIDQEERADDPADDQAEEADVDDDNQIPEPVAGAKRARTGEDEGAEEAGDRPEGEALEDRAIAKKPLKRTKRT